MQDCNIITSRKNYKYNIDEIIYQSHGCFGSCPKYTLTLYKNNDLKLYAFSYNKINKEILQGDYISKLKEEKLIEIIEYINKIDVDKYENDYANMDDFLAITIEIKYNNKQNFKKIHLQGKGLPKELNNLSDMLNAIYKTQEWKKDNP